MRNVALTRTRARVALAVLKTCFAEEDPTASLFRRWILSSRSDALALRVRVAISADLVWKVQLQGGGGGARSWVIGDLSCHSFRLR